MDTILFLLILGSHTLYLGCWRPSGQVPLPENRYHR
jgi:hypothetical protein